MYADTDLEAARRAAKRAGAVSAIFLLIGLSGTIAGLMLRVKPLALSGLGVGACAAYFYAALKAYPHYRYARFLEEMSRGLAREARVFFERFSSEPRVTEEGVRVFDLIARDEAGEERLFYFDGAKPMPSLATGQAICLTAYGRYVTGWRA